MLLVIRAWKAIEKLREVNRLPVPQLVMATMHPTTFALRDS